MSDTDYCLLRHRMVDEQLCARHIADQRVLAAMEKIPRHLFLPAARRHSAYEDRPMPIGLGQTISQPYMVAKMTELLQLAPTDRVLEIGTGSGYQAAVIAELAAEVWSMERHSVLARRAEALLLQLGYDNVRVIVGDGTLGLSESGPYNAIIVTAAAPHVPSSLRKQMTVHGRMVIPVSAGYSQDLRLIECLHRAESPSTPVDTDEGTASCFRETSILSCVFVPLVGEQGYRE